MSVGIGGGVSSGGGVISQGISMAKALGMMGGSPVIKSGDVFINKLKAAKTLESGDVSGLMDKVMGGNGLSGLLKNPMSNKGGQAKGKTSEAMSGLANRYPNSQLDYSVKDLDKAIDELMDASATVVGIGGDASALIDVIGHTGTLGAMGDHPLYSEATLLKPALSDAEMDTVISTLDHVYTSFFGGGMTENEAVSQINQQVIILRNIVYKSQVAMSFAQDTAILIASVSAVASLLQGGSENWKEVMNKAILENVRAQIDALNLAVTTFVDDDGSVRVIT